VKGEEGKLPLTFPYFLMRKPPNPSSRIFLSPNTQRALKEPCKITFTWIVCVLEWDALVFR